MYRKISIYHVEKSNKRKKSYTYLCSTNKYKTCREAKESIKGTPWQENSSGFTIPMSEIRAFFA